MSPNLWFSCIVLMTLVAANQDYASATEYTFWANRLDASRSGRIYTLTELADGPEFFSSYGPATLVVRYVPIGGSPRCSLVSGVERMPSLAYQISGDWPSMAHFAGDVEISRFKLNSPPAKVCVSGTGLGIVLADNHGPNRKMLSGETKCITQLSYHSQVIRSFSLNELFGDDVGRFEVTADNVWWFHDCWIDEVSGNLVVLARIGNGKKCEIVARSVDLANGHVSANVSAFVHRAIANCDDAAIQSAIEFATFSKDETAILCLKSLIARVPAQSMLRALSDCALMKIEGRFDRKIVDHLKLQVVIDDEARRYTRAREFVNSARVEWFADWLLISSKEFE